MLRRATDEAGGQKAFASQHGVSQAYISDVLRGRREPGPAILNTLGLVAQPTTYQKAKS